MRFTCTLAAFLVAAAAAASIVGAAPLPDVDSGQAEGRSRRASEHCPRDFPFATHGPAPLAGNICYNDADSAKKGTGNCGTWCTKDVNVGTGCGGNQDRICSDDEGRTMRDGDKIRLKSWKGDYLHRPDSAQGVTTYSSGIGNEWTVEVLASGKISLKSWKGDYLHRPDSAQGVTTWSSGIGNEWTVELLTSPFKVVEGGQFCQMTSDNCVTDGLGAHNNNERCVIQVQRPGVLVTPEFDVESHGQCDWDSVEVGGTKYCGTDGPAGVSVSAQDTITWTSDPSVTRSGWTICLVEEAALEEAALDAAEKQLEECKVNPINAALSAAAGWVAATEPEVRSRRFFSSIVSAMHTLRRQLEYMFICGRLGDDATEGSHEITLQASAEDVLPGPGDKVYFFDPSDPSGKVTERGTVDTVISTRQRRKMKGKAIRLKLKKPLKKSYALDSDIVVRKHVPCGNSGCRH